MRTKFRPYRITKPITRRIDDELVVTITTEGVLVRKYKCRKSVLVPWDYVIEMATNRARGKPLPGRLFDVPQSPDVTKLSRFRLSELLEISGAPQPSTLNHKAQLCHRP